MQRLYDPGLLETHRVRRGMLERDAELAALAHAPRGKPPTGAGSVVLVKGEAGIGKSSLVEALRSHLPHQRRVPVFALLR